MRCHAAAAPVHAAGQLELFLITGAFLNSEPPEVFHQMGGPFFRITCLTLHTFLS